MAADEHVVCNVEIVGSGPVALHAPADVLDSRVRERKPVRSDNALDAREKANFGISHGDAIEMVIVAAHHVEQDCVPRAVEDDLAVTGGLDRDRGIGRTVGGQVVRSVERRRKSRFRAALDPIVVMFAVIAIFAGMNQNRIARPNANRSDR